MKKFLLSFISIICITFCMNAEIVDIYKSINYTDPSNPETLTESVTFACTITGIDLSELSIIRETVDNAVTLVVENGTYNQDEWYAKYDTLEYISNTQDVRFADTFIYPFGSYDRTVTYYFLLDYDLIYTINVNFSKDPDIATDINEINYINRNTDKVYDVYGHEVSDLQPNTVYIKNKKKFVIR